MNALQETISRWEKSPVAHRPSFSRHLKTGSHQIWVRKGASQTKVGWIRLRQIGGQVHAHLMHIYAMHIKKSVAI